MTNVLRASMTWGMARMWSSSTRSPVFPGAASSVGSMAVAAGRPGCGTAVAAGLLVLAPRLSGAGGDTRIQLLPMGLLLALLVVAVVGSAGSVHSGNASWWRTVPSRPPRSAR
ncbi:hypothetical protein ACFVWZ_12955 [Streptomyces sp. NPDC058200]|uniref:hypothetical protein n=1 Tax=Streptomyces sp. NPDC058200 TaxID=3346378 RepID=UPI0036F0D8C7